MDRIENADRVKAYCDFRKEDAQPLKEDVKSKIVIAELDEFGHVADLPQGVRKLNILL